MSRFKIEPPRSRESRNATIAALLALIAVLVLAAGNSKGHLFDFLSM